MKVYDYSKIEKCVICGNINNKLDKFIKIIIGSLEDTSKYYTQIHPKEIERLERLKRESEMDAPNGTRQRYRRRALAASSLDNYTSGINLAKTLVIVSGSNCFGEKPLEYYLDKLDELNKVLHR